jgi:hypothetical protein
MDNTAALQSDCGVRQSERQVKIVINNNDGDFLAQPIERVGGEILVKRGLESEADCGNVAATRGGQVRPEQLRMRRRVARASSRRASDGLDACCNKFCNHSACAPSPRRSKKYLIKVFPPDSSEDVRRTDVKAERTEPISFPRPPARAGLRASGENERVDRDPY